MEVLDFVDVIETVEAVGSYLNGKHFLGDVEDQEAVEIVELVAALEVVDGSLVDGAEVVEAVESYLNC